MRLSAALDFYATDRLSDEVFDWGARALQLPGARSHQLFPLVSASVGRGVSNRGDLARATALAEAAVDAAAGEHDRGRLVALHALSAIRLYQGQLEDCMRMASEEAELARQSGDLVAETLALLHQVLALTYAGDSEAALRMADSALELAQDAEVPDVIAWALYANGEARLDPAPERACELLERSIGVARSVHNRFAEGVALASLTSVRARHGPAHAALEQFRRVIQHWRRTGDWTHQWTTMRGLVQLLARLHCHEAAAVLHGAVTASPTATPVYGSDHERLAVVARGLSTDLGPDRFETAFEAGAALPREVVVARALDAIDEALAFT
ncbi:MAG: hypothetical protein M3N32_05900 [Actinomycetota bacterium]|nr:hypothetical protein [Actinomycetota bacterium]